MVLFGLALGALLVYLGGLMVVDICSKKVSGTALGFVGIASYLGAGIQNILSGIFIGDGVPQSGGGSLRLYGGQIILAPFSASLYFASAYHMEGEV